MTPVIDVHVHLFNALDLPMEGYLRSRRIEKRRPCDLEYIINFFPGPQTFYYLVDRMRDRCITRQLGRGRKGWFYRLLLAGFGKYMGQELNTWEDSLSKTVKKNAMDLTETWSDIDLFVPLIADYEYWFKNTIDNPIQNQIETMYSEIILPYQGRFHAFVPFDPARELAFRNGLNNPDGQPEKLSSLETVKHAIENLGFVGVKLYNTLGYRPLKNSKGLTPLYRQRISMRNETYSYFFDGDAYDKVLKELYSYCEKNEVPITAHCMSHGIEAYPGASYHFGAAELWRPVLEQFPKIRLNLAHFGWNPVFGYGYGNNKNWMKDICQMLVDYDHLYTDVAHHEVVTRFRRPDFVQAFKKIQQDFSTDLEKIKKRILYGSDWHVLRRVKNYRSFLKAYQRVMKRTGFYDEDEISDFLGGNAMAFLGLLSGGKNRIRLEKFYQKQGIPLPKWFDVNP